MKVTLLLADSAQAVSGKLYILGGGWSIAGPAPTSFALAIKVEVPWTEANVAHRMVIELLDADGRPVMFPGKEGEPAPMRIESPLEVGRPAGLPVGTPLDAVLVLNFLPMPLPPGARYVWRVSINGEAQQEVGFSTRSQPPQQQP